MSIIQGLIAGVSNTTIIEMDKPDPGTGDYTLTYTGVGSQGTPYDPGGAINTVYDMASGLWRRHFIGNWNSGSAIGDINFFDTHSATYGLADTRVSFGDRSIEDQSNYAFEWLGYIQAPGNGTFNFALDADDYAKMWIGSTAISGYNDNNNIFSGISNSIVYNHDSVQLTAGKWYPVRIWFQEITGGERMQLYAGLVGETMTSMNQWTLAFNTITSGFNPPAVQGSGLFVESDNDYLEAPAGSHFNLGTTWTIEFWMNANASSTTAIGGIWGLLNQVGWDSTNAINIALSDGKLCVGQGPQYNDVRFTEPTISQWTHVAIVNDAGTQKVFYNGIEQTKVSGTYGTANYTNTTDPLRIGRLGPHNGGTLDGKITNLRITDQAQYSSNFVSTILPTINSGHTKLLWTPTQYDIAVDTGDLALSITNNGVTYNASYPTISYGFGTIPSSINEGSSGTFNVKTVGVSDATLYWTIESNAGQFATSSGSFALTSNTGSFTVTPTADNFTEGSMTFTVAIRTGSTSGTIVATSSSVTINDTSLDPTIHGSVLFGNGESDYMITSSAGRKVFNVPWPGQGAGGVCVWVGSGASNPNTQSLFSQGYSTDLTGWTVTYSDGGGYSATVLSMNPAGYPGVDLSVRPEYVAGRTLTFTSPDFASRPWYLGNVYTVEFWSKARIASTGGQIYTIACQTPSTTSIDIFYVDGKLRVTNDGFDVCNEPTPGVWTHVAIVNDSGTITVYYNGVSQYSGVRNITLTDSDRDLVIGKRGEGNYQYFDGKLTNMRITNTLVYTSDFVPSVLPLKVTGTKLLWTPTNYGITTDTSDLASTITNHGTTYNTDYPNEFAYEAIQAGGGVLTMTKSINGLSVQAAATNFDGSPAAGSYISIGGTTVASDTSIGVGQLMTRGHTMVVVNKETNTIESINTYDTYQNPGDIEGPLYNVTTGRIVILVSYDATGCSGTMRTILANNYGATDNTTTWAGARKSHLFIGVKR